MPTSASFFSNTDANLPTAASVDAIVGMFVVWSGSEGCTLRQNVIRCESCEAGSRAFHHVGHEWQQQTRLGREGGIE